MDVRLVWDDTYTKEKKVASGTIAERLAMLYNLAVIYSQLVSSSTRHRASI